MITPTITRSTNSEMSKAVRSVRSGLLASGSIVVSLIVSARIEGTGWKLAVAADSNLLPPRRRWAAAGFHRC